MRVYLDTNVIMEYFGNRKYHDDVSAILRAAEQNSLAAFFSSNSLDTIIYLLGNQLKDNNIHEPEKNKQIRKMVMDLLGYIDIVGISRTKVIEALSDEKFSDLEDSIQYYCPIENESDCLITINTKHFKKADKGLEVLSPSDFVKMNIIKKPSANVIKSK